MASKYRPSAEVHSEDTTLFSEAWNMLRSLHRTIKPSHYALLLEQFCIHEQEEAFQIRAKSWAQQKLYQNQLNVDADKPGDIFSRPIMSPRVSVDRILRLLIEDIVANAHVINKFARDRLQLENNYAAGNFVEARAILNKIESYSGISIWLIQVHSILLKEENALNLPIAAHRYWTEAALPAYQQIVECINHIGSDEQPLHFNLDVIKLHRSEYYSNGHQELGDLFTILLLPYPLFVEPLESNGFRALQLLPRIDLYLAVVGLLRRDYSNWRSRGEADQPALTWVSDRLRSVITDSALRIFSGIPDGPKIIENISRFSALLVQLQAKKPGDIVAIGMKFALSSANPWQYATSLARAIANNRLYNLSDPILVSPFGRLVVQLANIYALTPMAHSSIDYLYSEALRLQPLSQNIYIQLALTQALPSRFSPDIRATSASLAGILDYSALIQVQKSGNAPFDGQSIPSSVRVNLALGSNLLDATIDRSHAEKKEAYEEYGELCRTAGELTKLISFCAEVLIDEPQAYLCFPMEVLVDHISETRMFSLEAVVVSHVYSTYVSKFKEHVVNEAGSEHLESKGARKPTDLFRQTDRLSALQIYFLHYVCTRSFLEFLPIFKTSNANRAERIQILDNLCDRRYITHEERSQELGQIIEQVAIEYGKLELDAAKISIDLHTIRRDALKTVEALVETYKNVHLREIDRAPPTTLTSIQRRFELFGPKQQIAGRIFEIVLEELKRHLDMNLSGDIRHGFFPNRIRASLIKSNLLVELGSDNKFERSHFAKLKGAHSIGEPMVAKIDSLLQRFTSEIDSAIQQADDWMRIHVEASPAMSGRMAYVVRASQVISLRRTIEDNFSANDAIDYVIARFWEMTEENLTQTRNYLNNEFTEKVSSTFNRLSEGVITASWPLGGDIIDLGVINAAHSDIKDDIAIVTRWFKRPSNPLQSVLALPNIISLALQSYREVTAPAKKVVVVTSGEIANVEVPRHAQMSQFSILVSLLDNCYRHSGLRSNTLVEIDVSLCEAVVVLRISNSVSEAVGQKLDPIFLSLIDSGFRLPTNKSKMHSEGGSGLIKAFSRLKGVGPQSDMKISFASTNIFCVEVCYGIANTSC